MFTLVVLVVCVSQTFSQNFTTYRNDALMKTYIYFGRRSVYYAAATQLCSSFNAKLVMLRSQVETDWIYGHILQDEYWLGVEEVCGEDKFPAKFVDGIDIEWYNWGSSQPKNYHRAQCVAIFVYGVREGNINNGRWYIAGTHMVKPVLCEKDSPLVTVDTVERNEANVKNEYSDARSITITELNVFIALTTLALLTVNVLALWYMIRQ